MKYECIYTLTSHLILLCVSNIHVHAYMYIKDCLFTLVNIRSYARCKNGQRVRRGTLEHCSAPSTPFSGRERYAGRNVACTSWYNQIRSDCYHVQQHTFCTRYHRHRLDMYTYMYVHMHVKLGRDVVCSDYMTSPMLVCMVM